jgi:thiamine biosynthesis protein ThiS
MDITVNGNQFDYQGTGSLDSLLKQLGANPEAVALMVNDQIIPRTERDAVVLKEGDRVEVLSFMGGG